MQSVKELRREKIKKRFHHKIKGTEERPRLTLYRSNKEIYGQLVNDSKGQTIFTLSSLSKELSEVKVKKMEMAKIVGEKMGELVLGKGIKSVVFDRNGFLYHGRVKAFAEGAREAGLVF